MPDEDRPSFLRKLRDLIFRRTNDEVTVLDLRPIVSTPGPMDGPTTSSRKVSEVFQGPTREDSEADRRTIVFNNPLRRQHFMGHSVVFMANCNHHSIQPGSRDVLGAEGIWVNDPKIGSDVLWEDDPEFGLFHHEILHIEEVLGRRGQIDGVPYVFDQILQVGRNVVIY
jgi:hypothetical protein